MVPNGSHPDIALNRKETTEDPTRDDIGRCFSDTIQEWRQRWLQFANSDIARSNDVSGGVEQRPVTTRVLFIRPMEKGSHR